MPANKNNDANQQQGPRGQKRRNEQPAPAQQPAKKNKQPEKGSRLEAETKLANLETNLKTVLKKIEDAEKEKEKIVDRIKHWKKELASRARDEGELNAEVEALFEQCRKKDEEVAKKAEENVGEESRTSWW